ncbi:N-acetyl-glucosamine-6-phosphate deacetylase [Peltigera leucophlebia]|nr:N-acetyl-glucosamine-6-phosphate deacetylase [Peltigera leucophlebia]
MKCQFVSVLATLIALSLALWPIPSEYKSGETVLWIPQTVKFNYLSSPIVDAAINRARRRLFEDKFSPWKFQTHNSPFEPSNSIKTLINDIHITDSPDNSGNATTLLAGQVDESYSLNITEAGEVQITAATTNGILHALETFTQLFYTHPSTLDVYTPSAPISIKDKPKFAHRGLNLDLARSWYPKAAILRTIDALAWNKLNRLHLHATDSQAWPLEIPALPDLAKKGAYNPSLSYSPEALADIQEYGRERGVEVIVEIDMPGHTASVALSSPELIAAYNIQPNWSMYTAQPPSGQLKLNSPAVYKFLEKLWADLLPRISPYSSYLHTGGDELNTNVYNLDETVGTNSSTILRPLLQKFVDFNHEKIRAEKLTPIVWEDMLLKWNLTLGKEVVVQTWTSHQAVRKTVAKGHKVLVGNQNYWYLDCGKGQWLDFKPGIAPKFFPFEDWCSPTKNWRVMYSYNPLHGIPENLTNLVLGGEVHLWSEQTDEINLDNMIWPRASAVGEVLWSGAQDASGKYRNQLEASRRLGEMRERMVRRGIRAGPVQMIFCTQQEGHCAM